MSIYQISELYSLPIFFHAIWYPCYHTNCYNGVYLVSFPDPTLKEGKGLVYIAQFPGRTGCSKPCDWHDNTSFWRGNTSTALTRMQYSATARCHMIITYKPHGVNLIDATEFRNATSSSPRNRSMYTRPFPSLRVRSGNETRVYLVCAKNTTSGFSSTISMQLSAISFVKTVFRLVLI